MKRITARDVHDRLKGRVDTEVMTIIVAMTEEIVEGRKERAEMAKFLDSLVNSISAIVTVQGGMKDRIDKMRREDLDELTSPYVHSEDPSKKDN